MAIERPRCANCGSLIKQRRLQKCLDCDDLIMKGRRRCSDCSRLWHENRKENQINRRCDAVEMRYVEGLTFRAIGKRLQINPERARYLVIDGLRRLKKKNYRSLMDNPKIAKVVTGYMPWSNPPLPGALSGE
jgi:hypothetical protein